MSTLIDPSGRPLMTKENVQRYKVFWETLKRLMSNSKSKANQEQRTYTKTARTALGDKTKSAHMAQAKLAEQRHRTFDTVLKLMNDMEGGKFGKPKHDNPRDQKRNPGRKDSSQRNS